LFAWLLAGTLDIAAAIFIYAFPSGAKVTRLLQGIASGLLGAKAFSGGLRTAALGLTLHYLIALIWTFVGLLGLLTFKGISRHLVLGGLAYGAVVWLSMNLIVLPLSNVHHNPIQLVPATVGATILMFCIGLPIALVIGRQLRDAHAL
jgi:uncharacterized membrane protein YagU involved in acid resistance